MAEKRAPETTRKVLDSFLHNNDGIDLLSFDFFDKRQLARLRWDGLAPEQAAEVLKGLQRLRRMGIDENDELAGRLYEAGLDSAGVVASIPEHKFLSERVGLFNGDEQKASAFHKRAVQKHAAAKHLLGNVKDMVGSRQYRTALFNNVDPGLVEYFESIPSYQDLFGSLNYCKCEHCRSMLSPSAYFLDIMRITDEYITYPNRNTIPTGYKLEERRPDLFTMKLDCKNTDTPVAYLKVVNTVLEQRIETLHSQDAYEVLSVADYPFYDPYNLPLQQIRTDLGQLKTTLASIYSDFVVPQESLPGVKPLAVARESLKLSIEQYDIVTTPRSGADSLSKYYGYDDILKHLPFAGMGALSFTAGETLVTGTGTSFEAQIKEGDQIVCNGETRTVTTRGSGRIHFAKNEEGVTGTRTRFTTELAPGDIILCKGEQRLVSSISSDTQLTVDSVWNVDAFDAKYQIIFQDGEPYDGPGVITFFPGLANVQGYDGTKFLQLKPGQEIQCAGETRAILIIIDDTQLLVSTPWTVQADKLGYQIVTEVSNSRLLVDLPWSVDATDDPYTIAPWDGLDHVEVFKARTGLTTPELNSLFLQDLDQDELDAGLANNFFINKTGEDLPYLHIAVDDSDPANPFLKIEGLSLYRLDRLNRFIRLSSKLDWSYANLNWSLVAILDEPQPYQGPGKISFNAGSATVSGTDTTFGIQLLAGDLIECSGETRTVSEVINNRSLLVDSAWTVLATEADYTVISERGGTSLINEEAIEDLASIDRIQTATRLPVDVVASFWHDMKNIGRVSETTPRDLFDRVFNNPDLFEGQDPYDLSKPPIPFDPARPLSWNVADRTGANANIRSRLLGALQVDDNDLTTVGNYLSALLGETGQPMKLTLANLTWLYRLTRMASLVELSINEYLRLLCLMYYPDKHYLAPPVGAVPATIAGFVQIQGTAKWLHSSSFTVYDLEYIITGQTSGAVDTGYRPADIRPFVENLALISEPARVTASVLIYESIDAVRAQTIFRQLAAHLYINEYGIFFDKLIDLASVDSLETVTHLSFITDIIDTEQSAQTYDQLLDQDIIDSSGHISASFNEQTNLDFLFLDDPDADVKIGEVRAILLDVRDYEVSVGGPERQHTAEVLNATKAVQEKNVVEGLAGFFAVSTEIIAVLLPFAAAVVGLDNYLEQLLTPLLKEQPVPPKVIKLISKLSINLTWVRLLEFSPAEAASVTTNPAAFNVQDPASLTLANLESLSLFKLLQKELGDRDNQFIKYLDMPDDGQCPGKKIGALARLTGWEEAQICALIDLFWPEGDEYGYDYNTVAGVARLNRCFQQSKLTGADIYFLLQLCSLSNLPIKVNGEFDLQNWDQYLATANATLGAVNAKYTDEEFQSVFQAITGEMDTANRNALLGYAIWEMNKTLPAIKNPTDLYEYLLIDVEMSDCATTSYIAQGIASVQLYMQRCRLNLEPGVTDLSNIPDVWWEWMSAYRVWEANRKIFFYPENYIDPTLRKSQTPIFKEFAEQLLQTNITDKTVSQAYENYFTNFATVANLVQCASYNARGPIPKPATVEDHATTRVVDSLYIFGRTNTEPYTYYFRRVDNRNESPYPAVWYPWEKIDLSIGAPYVAPVYAFGRLFIFWAEIDTGQSSSIVSNSSNAQTILRGTVKYSFYDNSGDWVQPQVLNSNVVVNAFPANYTYMTQPEYSYVQSLFKPESLFWHQPYVVNVARGLPGSGRISFVSGLKNVQGYNTQFERQIKVGDSIYCNGEIRVVDFIIPGEQIIVNANWTTNATKAEFKVIPKSRTVNSFAPFKGKGQVNVTKDLTLVKGIGTDFRKELVVGDQIRAIGQTRTVIFILDDEQLVMDAPWKETVAGADYTIIPSADGTERLFVFYGPDFDTTRSIASPTIPDVVPNPGKDAFIQERNIFNQSLYNSLVIASNATGEQLAGVVGVGSTSFLTEDLLLQKTGLLVLNYNYSGDNNPRPYKANLNKDVSLLNVVPSNSVLADNYWGNVSPTGVESSTSTGPARDLLFNVSVKSASVLNVSNQPGWFIFNNGDEAFLAVSNEKGLGKISDLAYVRTAPRGDELSNTRMSCAAYTTLPVGFDQLKFAFTRLTTATVATLSRRLLIGGIGELLSLESQLTPELAFDRFYPDPEGVPPPAIDPLRVPSTRMDFEGSYGDYFWEIFFHAPFLVGYQLGLNQRFDEARSWYQYIFNPMQQSEGTELNSQDRFWRFLPFRYLVRDSLISILTSEAQIEAYNDDPFDPDAIARLRPTAYQKAIVMKYIDNLINWGDYLFAQDTRESINTATQLYLLASELLGPKPEVIGECPAPEPLSFAEIKEDYPDGIPQFLIELENTPFLQPDGNNAQFSDLPFNDIHAYFCLPENEELNAYWLRIEDRLYKIRHCMNAQGVVRQLALFEPPLNPRDLIRAAAGSDSMALAPKIPPPIPNYRFSYMLSAAKSLASVVTQLGGSLLGALEKKDAEEMAMLRNSQEMAILRMTTAIKQDQIKQTSQTQESLQASLEAAKARYNYYTELVAKGLSPGELQSIQSLHAAMIFNILASVSRTAASIAYAVPNVGSPFAMTYGGQQIGSALTAASGVFEIGSALETFRAESSLTASSYDRRAQEWEFQAKLAEFDVQQITDQIAANQTQLEIVTRELEIHYRVIEQSDEMERFLAGKFTNKELYQWMISRLSTVYFQTYTLAYELAQAAQRAYQYEINTNAAFVNFGYWDNLRKGLLSGEGLTLALNQMEKAYINNNVRPLEIQRTVSLALLDPKALLDLKTKGECVFALTEKLFDYDYPGQYCRKLKSISISVPAVVGPYQNVKAVLTQLTNQIVLKPDANAVNFLLGSEQASVPGPDVLRSNWWINQQIAISNGASDNGMFQLSFQDERYLPFEGTGAVSSWRFSMPLATNQIDFSTISDVIVQLQYTAFDGGLNFRRQVTGLNALKPYAGSKLLSLSQQYSQDWFDFMTDHSVADSQTLIFPLAKVVPPHVEAAKLKSFYFLLDVAPGVDTGSNNNYITFDLTNNVSVTFKPGAGNSYTHEFQSPPALAAMTGNRKITFNLQPGYAPASLLKDGFLNPAVVRNIILILYYTGDVIWS